MFESKCFSIKDKANGYFSIDFEIVRFSYPEEWASLEREKFLQKILTIGKPPGVSNKGLVGFNNIEIGLINPTQLALSARQNLHFNEIDFPIKVNIYFSDFIQYRLSKEIKRFKELKNWIRFSIENYYQSEIILLERNMQNLGQKNKIYNEFIDSPMCIDSLRIFNENIFINKNIGYLK